MALASVLTETRRTGTGTVRSGATRVCSILLTPAAVDTTVIVRDNGVAGTIRASLAAVANGSSVFWESDLGIVFNTDVHVTLTGAGVAVCVGWTPLD